MADLPARTVAMSVDSSEDTIRNKRQFLKKHRAVHSTTSRVSEVSTHSRNDILEEVSPSVEIREFSANLSADLRGDSVDSDSMARSELMSASMTASTPSRRYERMSSSMQPYSLSPTPSVTSATRKRSGNVPPIPWSRPSFLEIPASELIPYIHDTPCTSPLEPIPGPDHQGTSEPPRAKDSLQVPTWRYGQQSVMKPFSSLQNLSTDAAEPVEEDFQYDCRGHKVSAIRAPYSSGLHHVGGSYCVIPSRNAQRYSVDGSTPSRDGSSILQSNNKISLPTARGAQLLQQPMNTLAGTSAAVSKLFATKRYRNLLSRVPVASADDGSFSVGNSMFESNEDTEDGRQRSRPRNDDNDDGYVEGDDVDFGSHPGVFFSNTDARRDSGQRRTWGTRFNLKSYSSAASAGSKDQDATTKLLLQSATDTHMCLLLDGSQKKAHLSVPKRGNYVLRSKDNRKRRSSRHRKTAKPEESDIVVKNRLMSRRTRLTDASVLLTTCGIVLLIACEEIAGFDVAPTESSMDDDIGYFRRQRMRIQPLLNSEEKKYLNKVIINQAL